MNFSKTIACAVAAIGLVTVAGLSIAQTSLDRYEGREHLKIDHEYLKTLSWEERRTYMQAWKDARAADAAAAGIPLSTERVVEKLDQPVKVATRGGRVAGTISYDTGTVFGTAGLASQMLGNRFDTAAHRTKASCCFPVDSTGSITMVTFEMVNTFFSSAVWSLYSNVAGTTAMRVTSMGTGVMTGLNTISVANAYSNGSFLAGIFQFMPASTGLAVDTGTALGQGFHAISLNDGTTGTALTTVTTGGGGGFNAIFRVSGDFIVPIELEEFKIE